MEFDNLALGADTASIQNSSLFNEKLPFSKNSNIKVKSLQEIPSVIWSYFELDSHRKELLLDESRLLHSQVCLHEIEENLACLQTQGHHDLFRNLDHALEEHSLGETINLLRSENLKIRKAARAPMSCHQSYKIRNNQVGWLRQSISDLDVIAVCELGTNYKKWNQDAVIVDPSLDFMMLADGMGGLSLGEIASCLAIDFTEYALKKGLSLDYALVYANEAILTRSHQQAGPGASVMMGAAVLAARYQENELSLCHMGDVKALVIGDGKVKFETLDHTHGQDLLREGLVDEVTAKELNHILSRSLGIDHIHPQRDLEHSRVHLVKGDRVLILSDGVSDNFYSKDFSLQELISLVGEASSIELAARQLWSTVAKRMQKGTYGLHMKAKADNFSFILAEKKL